MIYPVSHFFSRSSSRKKTLYPQSKHGQACFPILHFLIFLIRFQFSFCLKGRTLDVFAREPLWKIGLDYRHGTGHGIGHFLNVHEGTSHEY